MVDSTLYISKLNEVYLKVECEPSEARTLSDYFTFEVPGAKFMPAYRSRVWDGKIRLYSMMKKEIYIGLLDYVLHFAKEQNYHVIFLNQVNDSEKYSDEDIKEISSNLSIHKIIPRDYQLDAVKQALSKKKCILVSPTASGKSLIIYIIIRELLNQGLSKILLVVPTTSLVEQMYSDFRDYSTNTKWKVGYYCHRIYSGHEKYSENPVIISTWQSIHKQGYDFFEPFDVVIGDEAHGFKAKALTSIMTKLINTPYRIGTTGTLDGTKTHKLVLEGLFGPVYNVTTTKELMDSQHLANLQIHCIVLEYPEILRKNSKKLTYQQEISFLIDNEYRNKFIIDMVSVLNGNTLVLYQMVEKHGKLLYDGLIEKEIETYFIHGGIKTSEREEIRNLAETKTGIVIVASYGTYSTGVNIKNLHNVVFASPSKSRIRNLQSIGRGLRKSGNKDSVKLFDISDDMSSKSYKNYTFRHLLSRIEIYNSEKFDYEIKKIPIYPTPTQKLL